MKENENGGFKYSCLYQKLYLKYRLEMNYGLFFNLEL